MSVNRFSCPGCKSTLKITTPELVGKKIRCPKCAAIALVPGDAPRNAPALAPKPEIKPAPMPAPAHARIEEDEIADLLSGGGWGDEDAPTDKGAAAATAAVAEGAPREVDPADTAMSHDEETVAVRKRPAPEEEDEDHPRPRKAAKPPRKKGGGILVPLLVLLIVLGYAGGATATLMGMFDPDPAPAMTKDAAEKYLESVRPK